MKNKKVIYTAIFGKVDNLIEPSFKGSDDYDFVCFTDNKNLVSNKYKIIVKEPMFDDSNLSAKIYKVLPHIFLNNYEVAIWIDGNIKINSDPWSLFADLIRDKAYVGFVHGERRCVYQEAWVCIQLGRGRLSSIERQIQDYKKDGFPVNRGLYENSIICRKIFDKELIEMEDRWWQEIRSYSTRDQLSLPYILWKLNYKIGLIDKPIRYHRCFDVHTHSY